MTAISRAEAAALVDENLPDLAGWWAVSVIDGDVDELELTPAQVHGLACVLCGAASPVMAPVGRTEFQVIGDGVQGPDDQRTLFACNKGCDL